MAQQIIETRGRAGAPVYGGQSRALTGRESQAFGLLYLAFIAAPLIAGIDKFFHYLVDWNIYLSPAYASIVNYHVDALMRAVGVVEIAAGLLVAAKPSVGGVVVACWLWGIIVNLLVIPGYYDIALRDFGLSLGALALSRLAADYGR